MKILIVEDDKSLCDGIALSLNTYDCAKAYTLARARELLNGAVSLIILDINLPDGSGLDFCRDVRRISDVPIIFLTANDMEIDIVSGLELGADDYITKPCAAKALSKGSGRPTDPLAEKFGIDIIVLIFKYIKHHCFNAVIIFQEIFCLADGNFRGGSVRETELSGRNTTKRDTFKPLVGGGI